MPEVSRQMLVNCIKRIHSLSAGLYVPEAMPESSKAMSVKCITRIHRLSGGAPVPEGLPESSRPAVPERLPESNAAGALVPEGLPKSNAAGALVPEGLPESNAAGALIPEGLPESNAAGALVPEGLPEISRGRKPPVPRRRGQSPGRGGRIRTTYFTDTTVRVARVLRALLVLAALAMPLARTMAAEQDAAATDTVTIDADTEMVIHEALNYLAKQQGIDGSWTQERGSHDYPVAMTGYALMAFLSTGNLPDEGEYGRNVTAGMQYLLNQIQPDGLFRNVDQGKYMYSHGIATVALCEIYGETRSAVAAPAPRRNRKCHSQRPKQPRRMALHAQITRRGYFGNRPPGGGASSGEERRIGRARRGNRPGG